jgi:hypothetical protein
VANTLLPSCDLNVSRFAGRVTLWLIELLIHDFPDGASTASATNSATEKSVDRARGTARHHLRDSSHLVVAQYVAGANNHRKMPPTAGLHRKYSRIAMVPSPVQDRSEQPAQQDCLLRQYSHVDQRGIDDELTRSAIVRMRIEDERRISRRNSPEREPLTVKRDSNLRGSLN